MHSGRPTTILQDPRHEPLAAVFHSNGAYLLQSNICIRAIVRPWTKQLVAIAVQLAAYSDREN
ncbi:MAG: hypothetical protein JWQ39_1597 [Glaciihabitans sp.]|nr:hypothetical protein [Glaciihabitans sp.]